MMVLWSRPLGGRGRVSEREREVYIKCATLVFKFLYIQFNQSDCDPLKRFLLLGEVI